MGLILSPYKSFGTDITEANVTDPRFFDITEGLAMFSRNENILSLHGENNKEYYANGNIKYKGSHNSGWKHGYGTLYEYDDPVLVCQ